jgi:hypothetical protein
MSVGEEMHWQKTNKETGPKKPFLKIERGRRTVENRERKRAQRLKERSRKYEVI